MEKRGGKGHFRPTNGPSVTDHDPATRGVALEALTNKLRELELWGHNAFRKGARGLTFPSRRK